MQNGNEASPSINLASQALLVKMPKTLGQQTLYTYVFSHYPATGMQNGDEALPSIILASRALLMKMVITLELHGIFCSNFVYYCILTLSNRCYVKR